MAGKRVAVVTGANKGIGLAIVQSLAKSFNGTVYLTSRDQQRGLDACKQVQEQTGRQVEYHPLDIESFKSIMEFKEQMMMKHNGLDVLVNNAGVKMKDYSMPAVTRAKITMSTNYFGTLNLSNAVLPLIKPQGRVVNVAGFVAQTALKACSKELQQEFRSEDITVEQLTSRMHDYIDCSVAGNYKEVGFPEDDAYSVSKIGVAVMSMIQARKMRAEGREDVLVNACCPGWCRTDMAGEKALKSAEEGAVTPDYLVNLPPGATEPSGKFISNKRVARW